MHRILGGLFVFFLTAHVICGQETYTPFPVVPKLDASYFERVWGMGVREGSYSVVLGQRLSDDRRTLKAWGKLTYILEFRRDIIQFDLDELQRVMTFQNERVNIRHFFFDKEDVAYHVRQPYLLDGDISGAKGEALRVTIEFLPITLIAPPGQEVDPAQAERARAGLREVVAATKKVLVRPGTGHR